MPRASGLTTPFGQQLRFFRRQRGLSQLELAARAETTPRHVSFVETGRSRPGKELILRLSQCMELSIRDRNALLGAAGFPAAYAERALSDEEMGPLRSAIELLLERHDPYPGCAVDLLGRVKMTNATCRALFPGVEKLSAEEALDGFLGPGPGRDALENWAEVAWAAVDRMQGELARTNHPELAALVRRGLRHLADVPRPEAMSSSGGPLLCVGMRVGDQVIRAFTTVMRFEGAREVTASELRVELIFPMDEAADAFFRGLGAAAAG